MTEKKEKQKPFEYDRTKENYAIVKQSEGRFRVMCTRGLMPIYINNGKSKYFKSEQDAMGFIERYEGRNGI